MKYLTLAKLTFANLMVLVSPSSGGCALHELSVDSHAEQLAPTLGVDQTDIQLLSACDFGTTAVTQRGFRVQQAIVAVTDSDLRFITRNGKYLFSKDLSTMPGDTFSGVSLQEDQLQLKMKNQVLILQLDGDASQEKYQQLLQAILAMGVPGFESSKLYVNMGHVRSARRSRGSGVGGYGGYADNPRDSLPNAPYPDGSRPNDRND